MNTDNIAARSARVLAKLTGDSPDKKPILSKAAQLKQFRERTADTANIHPDIAKIIKERGYSALQEYLAAMSKLARGQ